MDIGYNVADLAGRLHGRIEGSGAATVTGLASLTDAGPSDVTFLANPRYAAQVRDTRAAAVIVREDWKDECPCAVIRVKDPDRAFTEAALLLRPPEPAAEPGIHPTAVVHPTAQLGVGVAIGPHAVVEGGATIGDRCVLGAGTYVGRESVLGADCLLYPNVVIRERIRVGQRAIFHCGAVIGSDGFGYYFEGGAWKKIPQLGTVEVGDDVEIGANATIDRARFGRTVIGNGVKIDNLVQIAHNVTVGDHTAMAAQVGISGSTAVGRGVRMGGQAGATGHVEIGDGAIVAGRAGVTKDVPPRTFVSGFPARPHRVAMRIEASMAQAPDLRRRLAAIERRLGMAPSGETAAEEQQ